MSISQEPLQRPEKLKGETRASAARDTQEEVVVQEGTDEGARGQERSAAFCQHLYPQAAGTEEELLPGVDVLLEVFPTCSVEQAQWVLAKARGDLEEAVQMLVEGKEEEPPAWDGSNQVSSARPLPSPRNPSSPSYIPP